MRSIFVPIFSLVIIATSALMLGVSASAQAAPMHVPQAMIKHI